jgi:hypothetical protein
MRWKCFVLIALVACSGSTGDKMDMPGIYARYHADQLDEDSFTRLYDTLEIKVQGHPRRKMFDIIRRYETFQIVDGKELPAERKIRRWTGTLEETSQTITVFGHTRVISFYPDSNSLKLGNVQYFKIKRKS